MLTSLAGGKTQAQFKLIPTGALDIMAKTSIEAARHAVT